MMRALRLLSYLLALLPVRAGGPVVAVTRIKNLPSKLFYFEDTTVSPFHPWVMIRADPALDGPPARPHRIHRPHIPR